MINHSRGKDLFLIKYLINNRARPACDEEALSPAQTPQVFRYKGPFLPKSSDTNSPSLPIGEGANSPSLPIAIPQVFRYQLPKSSDRGEGELPKSSDSLPTVRSGLLDGEIPFCLSGLPKSSDTQTPSVRQTSTKPFQPIVQLVDC